MDTEKQHARVWIALILAALAVIIVYFAMPTQQFKPTGLVLPAAQTRPPTSPANIALVAAPPANYEKLGIVSIMRHYSPDHSNPAIEKQIINAAKQKAAKVGANAILVKIFGHTTPGSVMSVLQVYQFRGEAIYIPKES